MLEKIRENGLHIINGNTKGDAEGDFTYIGERGRSVSEDMKIGRRIESDHLPLETELRMQKEEERKTEHKWRADWSKEGIKKFKEKIEEIGEVKEWKELKEKIQKAAARKKQTIYKEDKKDKWWDGECIEWKKGLKEELTKCAREESPVENYRKKKKEYRGKIQRKKETWVESWTEKLKKDKSEKTMWKSLNRGRKIRNALVEEITDKKWREHFKKQLEGKEIEGTSKKDNDKERWEEDEIEESEVRKAIKKLKRNKASGPDKIANEAWIEGKEVLAKELTRTLNEIWKIGKIPEE